MRSFSPHMLGAGAAVSPWGLWGCHLNSSRLGPSCRLFLCSCPLGRKLMRWICWNSFYKQDIKGHYNTSNCHSSMQSGSNHSGFVKHTPNSLLFGEQPGFKTRYFLEVGTGAHKEQTKHQNSIQGVHVRHGCWARTRVREGPRSTWVQARARETQRGLLTLPRSRSAHAPGRRAERRAPSRRDEPIAEQAGGGLLSRRSWTRMRRASLGWEGGGEVTQREGVCLAS